MYKTMYQKYQIDNGKLNCKHGYKSPINYDSPKKQEYSGEKCQPIPLNPWVTPRYEDSKNLSDPIREDYAISPVNITLGDRTSNQNSCNYYECPRQSSNKFGNVNQLEPFYKIGPHPNLSDPAEFVYSMPNQNLVYASTMCPQNLNLNPWYGNYDAQ